MPTEYTPLMEAAASLNYERCEELLALRQTDPNIQDSEGKTALMHLLNNNSYKLNPMQDQQLTDENRQREALRAKIAGLLINDPRSNINIADSEGNTAFMYASKQKCYAVCEKMLSVHDIDIHKTNNKAETAWNQSLADFLLISSITHGNNALFDKLLNEPLIDINIKSMGKYSPLMEAEKINNQYVIDKLLKRSDIDINAQNRFGETILHTAVRKGNMEIITKLKDRTDINYSLRDIHGRSLEQIMIESDNPDVFLTLKGKPLNFDANSTKGIPLLFHALEKHKYEAARAMVELQMCNIDIRDKENGDTPLIAACRNNCGTVCRALMNKGADINAVNDLEQTALCESIKTAAASRYTNCDCLISVIKSEQLSYKQCSEGAKLISSIKSRFDLSPLPHFISALEIQKIKQAKKERLKKEEQNKSIELQDKTVKPKRPRIAQKSKVYSTVFNKKQKDDRFYC